MFPPRTTPGSAIATIKQWYPNIMDVETGNNPKIDNYIKDSVSKTDIAKAGAEFMKQPQSSRDRVPIHGRDKDCSCIPRFCVVLE